MTIAITVKVNEGIILAADSASTMFDISPSGKIGISHVYNTAGKVLNLCKGLPIGLISWGAGSIGHQSMTSLFKDLRRRFMGKDPEHQDWALDADKYNIEEVARRAREFIFEETFLPVFKATGGKWFIGFIVAGYSAGEDLAESWEIHIQDGTCADPELVANRELPGIIWRGDGQAIARLVFGFGYQINLVFRELGVPDEEIEAAIQTARRFLEAPLVPPAMPIQDAIDLAIFLAESEVKFCQFTPGAQTVGGPIDVAAITKHEGFKWIQRKFFYETRYNPPSE